jgi:competence protein ComEC
MPNLFATADNSKVARAALWGGREIAMLALASLIAGFATMPYAAFHFHRVTPYGVLANLAAMPVVSTLVMPAGLLGLLAMPFGFDGVFWRLMDVGIGWMVAVSQWVAALPGAIGQIASFGTGALAAMSTGIIALGLLRTPLRWAGAGLIALATVWALTTPQPDMLVAGDGHTVGVRGKDGRLRLVRTGRDAFLSREWLASDADMRKATDASLTDGVSCDASGCVVQAADGATIALTLKPEAFADDCARAAVIVTLRQPPADCAAMVLDQEMLRRRGTLSLHKTADGYAITAIRPRGVDRPWSPASVENEPETIAPRPNRPARPVDATPAENDLQPDD